MNTEQIKTELLTLATADCDLSALRLELVRLANRLTAPFSREPLRAAPALEKPAPTLDGFRLRGHDP